ncbi:hypothetical protein [Pedobacter cryophilus]|uniref:Uncharacterized protein n=1 Tax=Pedobacter cryophilus TaxID=2571271 RepID=A0A4V5NWX6_9SPHI|nr:hypothetical protein [Pedobacter cryophilus]TKB96800.1 hypothetical protein FA046_11995 [Pedobacter cryophilus]
MLNLLRAIIIVFLLSGCFSKETEKSRQQIYYFDLKDYFSKTALQLNKINPTINKSVSKNNIEETQNLTIKNWNQELALFIESDINKAAWKDSYIKDSTATKTTYTANDEDLRTQKIELFFENGILAKIKINSKVDNLLYQTKEDLEFIPDSAYSIKKYQKVILLGENNYLIKAKLN